MLKLTNVEKKYKNNIILSNISLEINEPGLFVIHGINGSGKSTLLKIISNIIYKSSGIIENDLKVSFLPDKYKMPPLMKVSSYIKHILGKKNIAYNEIISEYQIPNKLIGDLSKGNQQKLGLLQLFSNESDIYVLDEPLDGLDDFAKRLLKDKVIEAIGLNKIIIMSLHNKTYFNDLKPLVYEIKEGNIIEKKKRV